MVSVGPLAVPKEDVESDQTSGVAAAQLVVAVPDMVAETTVPTPVEVKLITESPVVVVSSKATIVA
ncbi:unannotated protein [freshwater metagenome]|uniref:Unannotated protein n=1 Tax=freshwater metagenome TaxID=449393 RepID=A0A6J7N003_9ZZZZ